MKCFNTQPPEGGWVVIDGRMSIYEVSTHSRPKAAAVQNQYALVELIVSTHSRPKAAVNQGGFSGVYFVFQHTAARRRLIRRLAANPAHLVSTHSRPKAAVGGMAGAAAQAGFNTQPPEGG